MVCKVLALIVLLSLIKHHDCGELKLKIEDVFVDYVNYSYFDEETFHITIEYESETKSTMDLRADIIKELPEDIAIKMKMVGRAFGQYTAPTGINMDLKLCQSKLRELLRPYMHDAGLSDQCPPNKGTYESNSLSTEVVGFPISLLPGLRFLIEAEVYGSNVVIMKTRCYIFVT